MLRRIGLVGGLGLLSMLVGLAVVAYTAPVVAAGLALVLVGVGLLAKGMVDAVVSSLGFGGGMP